MQCLSVQWVGVTVKKRPVTSDNTDVHLSSDLRLKLGHEHAHYLETPHKHMNVWIPMG